MTHEIHKSMPNHGRVVQNHTLAKREKNLKIDAPRCALVNFGSHFWGPGDTQISKKQFLLTLFFSVVFGCRKREGGAEPGIVVTGVWSLKRDYSLIKEVLLWVLFSVLYRIEAILKWSLWEEVSEMKSLKKSSLKHALVLKSTVADIYIYREREIIHFVYFD